MKMPHLATSSAHIALTARQVFDSRGRPTVCAVASLGSQAAEGDVPAGASKGADEAKVVPVAEAIAHIQGPILEQIRAAAVDVTSPQALCAIDAQLAAHAGVNFETWGANATLPVSRALWSLAAKLRGEPLWRLIRAAVPSYRANRQTHFYFNVFNGGLHALRPTQGEMLGRDRIAIQEIMVVPWQSSSYQEALELGDKLDAALEQVLAAHFDKTAITRADEAGFSVLGLGDSDRAIAFVIEAIERAGSVPGVDVKLALDVAAGSFFDAGSGLYQMQGEAWTGRTMQQWCQRLVERYPNLFVSIEDGLAEDDWEGWPQLSRALKARDVLTIGDDLFVTQLPRLQRGITQQAAHAVLVKPNQNGTVGGTLEVVRAAYAAHLECVVSHRSGETLDASIADLAYGIGAFGLKSGDPQPARAFGDPQSWVRRNKYLRMVAIEAENRPDAPQRGV